MRISLSVTPGAFWPQTQDARNKSTAPDTPIPRKYFVADFFMIRLVWKGAGNNFYQHSSRGAVNVNAGKLSPSPMKQCGPQTSTQPTQRARLFSKVSLRDLLLVGHGPIGERHCTPSANDSGNHMIEPFVRVRRIVQLQLRTEPEIEIM